MIDISKLAQGVDWKIAYAEVERHARQILAANVPTGRTIGTTELAECLLPAKFVRGDGTLYIRRRIFKALYALAERGLADCTRRAPPIYHRGLKRQIVPILWHAPDPNFKRIGPREMVEGDV